jgi:Tol biopolymer transport system component
MTIGSSRAVWFNRTGRPVDTIDLAASSAVSRLSPDGSQLAHARLTVGQQADLWVMDLTRRIPIPLTSSPADETSPVWAPDGTHLAYVSNRSGAYNIYRIAGTGSGEEEMLFGSGDEKVATDWSSDSRFLAFTVFTPEARGDIWLLDLQRGPRATPLLATAANEGQGRFAPDGRWLAYTSNRTGRPEINVQRLPSGISVRVSVTGGSEPFWSHDGRELFYSSLDYYLMSVEVDVEGSAETAFRAKPPTRLFKLPEHCYPLRCDISVDRAGRFLVVTADAPSELMRVVSNWMSRLDR